MRYHAIMKFPLILTLTCLPTLGLSQTLDSPAPIPAQESASNQDLSQAYQDQDWNKAIDIATQRLKDNPDDFDTLAILGISLAKTDQNPRAEEIFLRLAEKKTEDPKILGNLCVTQNALNKAEAANSCTKAANLNPDNATLQFLAGQRLEIDKKIDQAYDFYLKAWKASGKEALYLTSATSIDFARGNIQSAYDLTHEAIYDKGLQYPILYLNLLLATNRLGKYEETISVADEIYAKTRDDGLMVSKAEALFALRRFDEAEKLLSDLETRLQSDSIYWPQIELNHAKTLIVLACTSQNYPSCTTDQPDPCCTRYQNALAKLSPIQNHRTFKNSSDVLTVLAITNLMIGKPGDTLDFISKATTLEQAENSSLKENIRLADLLLLQIVSYQKLGGDDYMKNAQKLLETLTKENPQYGDISYIRQTHAWPEPLLADIEKMLSGNKLSAALHKLATSKILWLIVLLGVFSVIARLVRKRKKTQERSGVAK